MNEAKIITMYTFFLYKKNARLHDQLRLKADLIHVLPSYNLE